MREVVAMLVLAGCLPLARAQHEAQPPAPFDLVHLQADASREIDNDQLVAVLAAEAQGANPGELAEAVNRRMAEAIRLAREVPAVRLRSGNYQTYPRPGKDGRIELWHASQELRLESADFAAAARLVGRLQSALNVRSMAVRLSTAARRAAEDALIPEAIAAFQARAELARKAMKASGYRVRELNISSSAGGGPRPLMYAERAAAAPPVALEAGVSQVTVNVTGSIQLQ